MFHCILDKSGELCYDVREVNLMAEKKNSDAKIRANNKYTAAHYDRINMALPKGSRKLIAECAKRNGETVNRFVCRVVLEAVREQLRREQAEQAERSEFFDQF